MNGENLLPIYNSITEIGFETCDPQGFAKINYLAKVEDYTQGFGCTYGHDFPQTGLSRTRLSIDFNGRGKINFKALKDASRFLEIGKLVVIWPYFYLDFLEDTMVFDLVYRLCFKREAFDYFIIMGNDILSKEIVHFHADGVYHQHKTNHVFAHFAGNNQQSVEVKFLELDDARDADYSLFSQEMYIRSEITEEGIEQWVVHGRMMAHLVDEYRLRYRDGHSERVDGNCPDFDELFLRRERTGLNFDTQIQPFVKVPKGSKFLLGMEISQ